MGKSYRPYHPEQDFLLPASLREWLPENHLVYFVSDVVDNLKLSALDAVYGDEQRGQPPYDPRMMTKVLVYGYCVGVFSSRRIERRLAEDVGFRVLAAGNAPNFRPIADFRKLHLATLAGLFEEVLKIALEAGALKLGRVAETCHCDSWPHSHMSSRGGAKVPTERGRRRSSADGGGSSKSRPYFAHFGTACHGSMCEMKGLDGSNPTLSANQSAISEISLGNSKIARMFAHFLQPEGTGEA